VDKAPRLEVGLPVITTRAEKDFTGIKRMVCSKMAGKAPLALLGKEEHHQEEQKKIYKSIQHEPI